MQEMKSKTVEVETALLSAEVEVSNNGEAEVLEVLDKETNDECNPGGVELRHLIDLTWDQVNADPTFWDTP